MSFLIHILIEICLHISIGTWDFIKNHKDLPVTFHVLLPHNPKPSHKYAVKRTSPEGIQFANSLKTSSSASSSSSLPSTSGASGATGTEQGLVGSENKNIDSKTQLENSKLLLQQFKNKTSTEVPLSFSLSLSLSLYYIYTYSPCYISLAYIHF